jgi:hypothetical protein
MNFIDLLRKIDSIVLQPMNDRVSMYKHAGHDLIGLILRVWISYIFFLFAQGSFAIDKEHLIAGVKRIFLQNQGEQFQALLSAELSQKGYVITSEISDADAVLKGSGEIEVVLNDKPTYKERGKPLCGRYRYVLMSMDKKKIWTISFVLRNRSNLQGVEKEASVRIANKLDKAIISAMQKQKTKGNERK